jgi:hypothetical protein
MSAFKKLVYIQFYPDAWLNDPKLQLLNPDVKGFYMDLICKVFYCFPYGHCSVINTVLASKLQKRVNQRVNHVVVHEDNEEDNLWVDLTLNATLAEQLRVADNIEKDLHKMLPYSTEQITGYIRVLEEKGIISRTASGVLYVRRMVKDFKRKVVAYLNGSKGGNPKFKKRKQAKTEGDKTLKTNSPQNQVNQGGQPFRSYSTYPKGNRVGKGILKGKNEQQSEEGSPPGHFHYPDLYAMSWPEIEAMLQGPAPPMDIRGLTQEGFEIWKEFVEWVEEKPERQGVWQALPLWPASFQDIVFKKGFIRSLWEPVIDHMLGSGVGPQHNLSYRIPQFMGYHFKNNGQQAGAGGMDTGNKTKTFANQKKW